MPRCPLCGNARIHPCGEADGPICCEDCGFSVGGRIALPEPLVAVSQHAAAPPPPAPRQGGLADWAIMAKKKKAGKRASPLAPAGELPKRRSSIPIRIDYLYFPASTTVGQALQACQAQDVPGPSLLVTQVEGAYRICSLGSLLPYLTGRTPHIVHGHGDCPICSGLIPPQWQDTAALLAEAFADADACSRLLPDLPLAGIPRIEATRLAEEGIAAQLAGLGFRACAVTQDGVLCGVLTILQERAPGGALDF